VSRGSIPFHLGFVDPDELERQVEVNNITTQEAMENRCANCPRVLPEGILAALDDVPFAFALSAEALQSLDRTFNNSEWTAKLAFTRMTKEQRQMAELWLGWAHQTFKALLFEAGIADMRQSLAEEAARKPKVVRAAAAEELLGSVFA